MPINTRIVKPVDLTEEELAQWRIFQKNTPYLDSPFFSPEFSQIVSKFCPDTEIAIIENNNKILGFFPFHRQPGDIGQPIGLSISDFQGIITDDAEIMPDAAHLIKNAQLKVWHFDHLLTWQKLFSKYLKEEVKSPYIDLSHGFDSYITKQRQSGSSLIPQIFRKARKFAREIAPLRFEYHSTDKLAFEKLQDWKSDQRQATGTHNVLLEDWVVNILETMRLYQTPEFSGILSVLYVGDEIAAVHFGMRSKTVLHYWFPTYDPKYARFSPGLILLLEMAKQASEEGITRLDLGKGNERYKQQLKSDSILLSEGWVGGGLKTKFSKGAWFYSRNLVRKSPFYPLFTKTKRMLRRLLAARAIDKNNT